MNNNVGTIEYIARINTSKLKQDAKETENAVEGVADASDDSAKRSSDSFSKFAKVGLAAVITAATALTGTLAAAGKASFDQVAAVEQATVGLRAYEKDGSAVNAVLSDLIKYARSDLGVLFNRKDLFQSAQMLKLNGAETENLSGYVQILSRSVGLGLGNWDDLNRVVGRVASTGRLAGDDFDQLRAAGFRLDESVRNTDVNFQSLFEILDKGIPTDALEGQSNTIEGLGIRIQTAFRGIGDAILGVDAETSKFKPGSFGEQIIIGIKTVTDFLKSPEVKDAVTSIGTGIVTAFTIASDAIAVFSSIFKPVVDFISQNQTVFEVLKTSLLVISGIVGVLAIAIGVGLLGAFAIIVGVINAAVFVMERIIEAVFAFGSGIANVIVTIGSFVSAIGSGIATAYNIITSTFSRIPAFLGGVWNSIISIFSGIGVAVGNAIGGAVKGAVNSVLRGAVNIINGFIDTINGIVGVINNIPGVNIGNIGRLGIPALANGGIVTSPTLALVGEGRESEAVIPLSKLDKMMNNSEGGGREYNIGTININNDVEGERWLQKLTGNQEIVSGGLVPRQSYGS